MSLIANRKQVTLKPRAKRFGFPCLCMTLHVYEYMNIQMIHFTTNPLKFKHQSSSFQFHNIRLCHSNLVLIRMNKAWVLHLGAFHFVSLQWQNSIRHSSAWQHQAGTVTLGAYTSLKFSQKWNWLTAKQNDAFNLRWEIRKVNENTQSSFRLFSEGSLGGRSIASQVLNSCKMLGLHGRAGGSLYPKGIELRVVEVTPQLFNKEKFF